jgi:hypothetical protein
MKRLAIVTVISACVSVLALWTLPSGTLPRAQADGGECDKKGTCPLHDWMESEMDAAVEKGDAKALAASYEKVAGWAPDPKWNEGAEGWSKIAKDGAELAKKGDIEAARKLCKTCHKAFRAKYKEAFRTKALPK